MKLLFSTAVLTLLISCSPSKKFDKAAHTFDAQPDKAAQYCGLKFPPRDSTVIHDSIMLFADNKDYKPSIDSLKDIAAKIALDSYRDSVDAAESHKRCQEVVAAKSAENKRLQAKIDQLANSYKPCVPDTLVKTVNHYIANTAKEKGLEAQLAVTHSQLQEATDKWDRWKRIAIILGVAWLLYIGLKIFGARIGLPFKV